MFGPKLNLNNMALYRNQENKSPVAANQMWPDEQRTLEVAPAQLDDMLLDALEALEQARRLHQTTPNPETKRQARLILQNLHSSLVKLAPLGIHSAQRLDRVPATL
jgi:hypothetical protein